MNERIKLLAKTYLIHERFGPDGESTIEDYYEFYPEELEYFVGLIVGECCQICIDKWVEKTSEDARDCYVAIQEHFKIGPKYEREN